MNLFNFFIIIKVLFFLNSSLLSSTKVILPLKNIPKKIAIDSIVQVDESYVGDLLAEGLFDIGEGFQINPVLAKSVNWKNDGLTFQIQLKDGHFSDGTKVTIDDVIKNIKRCVKNAEEALSLGLQSIDGFADFVSGKNKELLGLRRISDNELEINIRTLSPLLPDSLTFSNCYIIKGEGTDLFGPAIGTGPYKILSRDDEKIILQKRSDYHRDNQGPDIVEFRATNSWGDFSILKKWATLINVEGDPGQTDEFNKFNSSQLGTYQLVLNNSTPPFNNESIRQALLLSLDFNLLAEELAWPKDRLQEGLFPFGMRGFKKRSINVDPLKAKVLLNKFGYTQKNPLKFTIIMAKSKISEIEAKVWPRAFKDVPIEVTVDLVDQGTLFDRRSSGDYQSLRIVKMPGTVDGHRLLTSYLTHSKFNTPKSSLPDCDLLIKNSLSIPNIDERYSQYAKADTCLMSHVTLIPLATIQPGYVLLRKPWFIEHQSRYNLRPYNIHKWRNHDS